MPILTRRRGETITVGDSISFTILGITDDQVEVNIDVPKDTPIHCKDVSDHIPSDGMDACASDAQPEVRIVRGYKVKVTYQKLPPAEAAAKRRAVAEVIARSLMKRAIASNAAANSSPNSSIVDPGIRDTDGNTLQCEGNAKSSRAQGKEKPSGTADHKRIQHLVKGLAEHRGFRAVIEDTILDGKGQVDVSLCRGDLRIACEISITTGKDHELGNVEKCLAAGYRNILLIGKTERQAKLLAAAIEKNLEEGHGATIHAIAEDAIDQYLQSFGNVVSTTTSVVRGIPVTTTILAAPLDEAAKRHKTLVDIVARMRKRTE